MKCALIQSLTKKLECLSPFMLILGQTIICKERPDLLMEWAPLWTQCYTTFYGCNLRIFVISQSICLDKHFRPRLMFVGKTGAYPRMEQLKFTIIGQAPGLSCKHWTTLERPVMAKLSSLLRKFAYYGRKKFSNIGPW